MKLKLFKEIPEDGTHVAIIFSASWCGPCKVLKRQIERLPEVDHFLVYDIEQCEGIDHAVESLPTISFGSFNNGVFEEEEEYRVRGADLSKVLEHYEEWLQGLHPRIPVVKVRSPDIQQ